MIDYVEGDLVVCVEVDYSMPDSARPFYDWEPIEVGKTYICLKIAEVAPPGEQPVLRTWIEGHDVRFQGLSVGWWPHWFRKVQENKHIEHLKAARGVNILADA